MKEVRRSTGHIMVTTRYTDQQGSKSRQNPRQVQPTEIIGNLSASRRYFGYNLEFLLAGVLQVFQNLIYSKLQRKLSGVLPIQQSHQKEYKKLCLALGGLKQRQVMRHFTSNGTDQQCQNSSSKPLTYQGFSMYREQPPRSTQIVFANFGAMTVGTDSLACEFHWQCTANDIGYASMSGVFTA